MRARWNHGFRFESTATGKLLSETALPLATRVAVSVCRGVVMDVNATQKSFSLRADRDASREVASALVSTKSLPILGYPLGIRVSAVWQAAASQQVEVSTSPLRVQNRGLDVTMDLFLDDDVDSLQQLRVSILRPQLSQNGWEISRLAIAAGELL